MLCENCKKRTATVFYNENINGRARSYSLCGECAAKLREKGDLQDVTSMLDSFANPFSNLHDNVFGPIFGIPTVKAASEEKKCPACGSVYSEIAKSGKVGCPDCYATFHSELSRLIGSVHGTTSHTGQAPARHRAKQARDEQLSRLRRELQSAIEKEDYESAAKLRDEIRALSDETRKDGE